jgi:hypothetical protein
MERRSLIADSTDISPINSGAGSGIGCSVSIADAE